jgi:hypothetical protein
MGTTIAVRPLSRAILKENSAAVNNSALIRLRKTSCLDLGNSSFISRDFINRYTNGNPHQEMYAGQNQPIFFMGILINVK